MARIAFVVAGMLAVLALARPADATLNACAAAKKLCVAKKAAALLKCHSKNEKPPAGLDPVKFAACVQKAQEKFDGGTNPFKGCFAKLEAKFGPANCLTSGDTAALETMTDNWVDAVVCALDPAGGTCPATPTPSSTSTPAPTSTPACFANGQACATASQCCSLACNMGTCVPSCSNGIQDGTETGVDCGGGSCPQCPLGGGCASGSDCVASTVCVGGQCTCASGQSNCNGFPGDGCEINLLTDVNNCGSCGSQCALPNAFPACNAAQCMIAFCGMGYSDCNNLTADGCEVNTQFDNNNCGACANVCPMPTTCVGGVCL